MKQTTGGVKTTQFRTFHVTTELFRVKRTEKNQYNNKKFKIHFYANA